MLPVPVVLGIPDVRDCTRLFHNASVGRGRTPLFLCGASTDPDVLEHISWNTGPFTSFLKLPNDDKSWTNVLHALRTQADCTQLMVEGGAAVISSLMKAHDRGDVRVDALIITIAPTMVGPHGIGYEGIELEDSFRLVRTETFGDNVVIGFVRR